MADGGERASTMEAATMPALILTPRGSRPTRRTKKKLKDWEFLTSKHPAYEECEEEWILNARRAMGRRYVADELLRFDWETENGPHYLARKNEFTYLNFPDRFATLMVGHMMRQAPRADAALNFGTLGKVRRIRDANKPTRAELLNYNTDGIGADGAQWNVFWTGSAKDAIFMGHSWVLAEGPPVAPANRRDEQMGIRPFLTPYSALDVTNWGEKLGQRSFAIIQRASRQPTIEKGELVGNEPFLEYLLLTKEGFTDLGPEWSDGGWYLFDDEGNLFDFGFYDQTEGEIPLSILYYERKKPTMLFQAISRPGVTELGNAAVSYMNQASAADWDAFDSSTSVIALKNVDDSGHNLFINKIKAGNRYAPLMNIASPEITTDIQDASTGAVVSEVFDKRLRAKRQEVLELMLNELNTAPDASGVSKAATWTDTREPRLSAFATELETAQNASINYMERMWGNKNPSGSVEWTKEFDLIDPVDAANQLFELEALSGLRSQTMGKKAMSFAVQKLGLVADNQELEDVEKEYAESAAQAKEQKKVEMQAAKNDAAETPGRKAGLGGAEGSGRQSESQSDDAKAKDARSKAQA